MTKGAIHILGATALFALALVLSVTPYACNLPTECDCGLTGALVFNDSDREIESATITGPCTFSCTEDEGEPCPDPIEIEATAKGTCHLELTFTDGDPAYEADIEFGFIEGDCCHGYYATRDRVLTIPERP